MQGRAECSFGTCVPAPVCPHDPPASRGYALPPEPAVRFSAGTAANLRIAMSTVLDEPQHTNWSPAAADRDRDADRDFLRSHERPTESAQGVSIVDLFSSFGGLTY